MPLYKIIIFKERTPEEQALGETNNHYQYGLLRAQSHFQAEEKGKAEFELTWALQGWKWHGCFYEDDRNIEEKVLWL
jgi:hypothetical protein